MFASCSSSSMRPGLCTVSAPLLAAPTTSPTAHTSSSVLSSSSSSSLSSSSNLNKFTSLSSPNVITTTSTLSGSGIGISLTTSPDLTAAIGGSNLPPSARFLALHLLHQQTLYFLVQVKSRVRELYHQTCLHFQQQGMLDTDLFGLALICDGEYLFAEPDSKLSKYAPKAWRSSHNHGLDTNGRPALAFYFRVQFYVDSPLLLRDETTRHHYYLQLRLNTAAGAAAEHTTRLAGLALQADLGNHTQSSTASYRPEDYVPPAMRQPAALRNVEAAHRSLRNLPRLDARLRFIATACQLQEPVNAHVFRLRASKAETAPGSLLLAVCARGLRVCQENNPHPSVFLWSSIGKLSFERKKFEIRTGHEKLTLYTTSDDKSRLLLNLCKATHQFSMAVAPRLTEAKQLHQQQQQNRQEEEDAEADDADQRLRWLDCDQRISVISSTSSNTTSGIVSDRVHSEDELEIMITSPPAPSTESLALAHLLDSAPASSRTSAASAAAALGGGGSVAPSMAAILPALVAAAGGNMNGLTITTKELQFDETERHGACSDTSAKTIASGSGAVSGGSGAGVGSIVGGGSSGGAINGGGGRCTAGSQCSSNCSTVVVTPAFTTKSKGRRPSTSSSLELGYSHTAQNSAVSDATCIELDIREPVYSAGPAPSSHTSGVYTLTSSDQYTLSSTSEQYTTNSERYSSTGESYSRTVDQVDGAFRDRSNSNVSNSGSFRGDGSDPTDNQQTLLSADELSDLIVGRYPSCKSVSNTLDSDSDYVTLPSTYQGYAPIPPKRIDSARPPPPPYGAQFLKHSDNSCELDEILSEISIRDPPPYPESAVPPPPPVYPSEEATARFITTRPPNILTAHTSLVGINSSPSYSVPPIPPKVPRPTSLISSAPSNGTLASSALSSSMLASSSLSIASSKGSLLVPCAFLPPPPPPTPRQPPPPPPLATVYTSQLSRSQIEQYRQQMYSDVDFVVFPLKEPAISKQEYLEAKQGSLLAALAQTQPVFYRSTPYLGRYASSQNLSDTYVQLPVYGAASIASTGSLEPVPPPLPPNRPSRFMRTQSDDNILNSVDSVQPVQAQPPKFRRLPPPPPPSPPQMNSTEKLLDNSRSSVQTSAAKQNALDIRTLRETSKKMDLPLISALCNDRSLIKQTKAFVMPKHPNEPMPRHVSANSAKMKYPVSGLSSARMNKVSRKPPSISHRHPGDKLPDLPKDSSAKVPGVVTTRATPNNYVFTDPRVKHKTMQSHS